MKHCLPPPLIGALALLAAACSTSSDQPASSDPSSRYRSTGAYGYITPAVGAAVQRCADYRAALDPWKGFQSTGAMNAAQTAWLTNVTGYVEQACSELTGVTPTRTGAPADATQYPAAAELLPPPSTDFVPRPLPVNLR